MEEFHRKLSVEILEKAFHALRVSFLLDHNERETLISFYQTNPELWNHGMIDKEIKIFDVH